MGSLIISPPKIYEVNGNVCKVLCGFVAAAVANNTAIVAAITGKVIRVMGFDAQAIATAANFALKNNSGAALMGTTYLAALGLFRQPITDSGYFETDVSTGLSTYVAGDAVTVTVFYIAYTPQ